MIFVFKQSNNQLNKLSIVAIPLVVYFVISYFLSNGKSGVSGIFGSFFSLYFIFGPGLADLFKNLTTIHLTKPFELGDLIEINNELFFVKEIGFQFTELEGKSGIVKQSNLLFTKTMIKKPKKPGLYVKTIYVLLSNPDMRVELENIVKAFIGQESERYGSNVDFSNLGVKGGNLSICVNVEILYEDFDYMAIEMGRDKIIAHLMESKIELNLVDIY